MATGKSASADADSVAGNTSEELAFLASRVCVPEVTQERETAAGGLEDVLTKHGYKLVSSPISRQLFGRVVPGFVAAQKESELGQFMIAFGGGLPACAIMLMNHSAIPPVKELREAFESQRWSWAHMGAVKPDRLPYAGFKRTDKNGKTILAVVTDNPKSDPRVRLGIDISYTDF
ncbi:MAG TPA: hypothetical protein VF645_09875 [Allosphingosinicella sp.]